MLFRSQLSQTDFGVLDYRDIKLVLKSQCQGDPTGIHKVIADTVSLTATFVPSCSDITLQIAERVMNTYNSAKIPILVKDYESSFRNIKGVCNEYKSERDTSWRTAQEFVFNNDDLNNSNELIEKGYINYVMDMNNSFLYPDQTYQFKAVTMCHYGNDIINNESEIIDVIKDMSKPTVIGKPSPSNGILTDDNEISLTFNEMIKYSSLKIGRAHV